MNDNRSRSGEPGGATSTATGRPIHVMVTLDGSEAASSAAEVAAAMFGSSARYSILSVGSPWPLQAISPMGVQPALLVLAAEDADPVVDVTAAAEATVGEAAAGLDVDEVETIVSVGDPGSEICRLAEERDVDVVVLGAHDRGWLSRLLEPSVARHVVDHAPCHVLVVRNQSEGTENTEGAEPR